MSRRYCIIVVSDPADAAGMPPERVVTADRYLEGGDEFSDRRLVVVNLCRSFRYRSKGYYVSLLADARGQQVIPSVETIEGFADPFGLYRSLQEAGVPTVDVGEARGRGNGVEERAARGQEVVRTLAYFGNCGDRRFRTAASAVHRDWPFPVLRLSFVREDGEWKVAHLAPLAVHQLAEAERAPLLELLAQEQLVLRRVDPPQREARRAAIAVLVDDDLFSPSSPETIDRLARVAARMNVHIGRIGCDEIDRLSEYDALFIRALTGVREPAFQFALRAEALDMPVIDDTQSIIRCSNKVFLEELLRREGIPTPRTLVLTSKTPWPQIRDELGLPFVLKLPDSSFSAAVHKISSEAEYRTQAAEMLRRSPLLIAQEWVPTEFDWRVTVLEGKLLFAARYHMARGHWQIRSQTAGGERYGRVEAVPRESAPPEVVELALRAASLLGSGLYGVDLKETPRGPVVIEINDNPNLDTGHEDAADGAVIYRDLINFFLRRLEEAGEGKGEAARSAGRPAAPSHPPSPRREAEAKPHYRPYEVTGIELEYPVVDRDLNVASLVEEAFRAIAGRPTSEVELGPAEFSNEIADHVFEVKTAWPTSSLAAAEAALVEGVARFAEVLRERFDARLLPTGMHPWMDPRRAALWSRSGARIYQTYARIFDVKTHGWMNVHATHVNLPLGREQEAVAMYNAAALLIPYLPALAASSPMYDGRLQDPTDGRLAWILEHQARIPESCGEIVPEYIESFADYRKRILGGMYAALDRLPDARALRHEFFNARGAILRFSRKAMEIRVLDTQECVKLDIAIAAFVRAALRYLTRPVLAGRVPLPDHAALVRDFRTTIRCGSTARVEAPHLGERIARDSHGMAEARAVLRLLLEGTRNIARKDELPYLDLVEQVIEAGSLSERIRAVLLPYAADEAAFTAAARGVYRELAECLERNEPWRRREAGRNPP